MSCVKMSERGFQVVHPLGLLSWSSRDVRVKFEHGECIFPVEIDIGFHNTLRYHPARRTTRPPGCVKQGTAQLMLRIYAFLSVV